MGLYNCRKLNNLREQVKTVAARQNRVLQITAVTLQRLDNLESVMTATMTLLAEDIDISLAHHQLQAICDLLHLQYQQIIRAVQAAHQCRLSVDLLNATRLQDLFHAAQLKAQIKKCQRFIPNQSVVFLQWSRHPAAAPYTNDPSQLHPMTVSTSSISASLHQDALLAAQAIEPHLRSIFQYGMPFC
jgi:hypothetical protein